MNTPPSNSNQHLLPMLKPKSSVNDQMIMSKIHVSKNWKLPISNQYKRNNSMGRKRKHDSNDADSASKSTVKGGDDDLSKLKKQKQNRDAQRAFRERKDNKLKELENVIESLQNLVRDWQRKYQLKDMECEKLQARINDLEKCQRQQKVISSRQETAYHNNIHHDDDGGSTSSNTDNNVLDLDNLIHNFKPMKPVQLRRKNQRQGRPLPVLLPSITNQSVTKLISTQPSSISSTLSTSTSRTRDNIATTASQTSSIKTPSSCGFCTESTSCICKELESSSRIAEDNKNDSDNAGDMEENNIREQSDDCMSIERAKDKTLTCSSHPETCTKCTNIDETCIKPFDEDKRKSDMEGDVPQEVDFTTVTNV